MGIRFSPCGCCDECENLVNDQFNRTTLGDWFVVSGTWACNGSSLTGSGKIYYSGSYGPPTSAAMRFKLNSGTVKAQLYNGFVGGFRWDAVQVGDGNITWFHNDFGLSQTHQISGPSTGIFKLCTHGGNINTNDDFTNLSVSTGSIYEADIPGHYPYVGVGFEATSTVSIDWVELFDGTPDCCTKCPGCKNKDAKEDGLIVDFGEDEHACGGITYTGEYLLDSTGETENTECRYGVRVTQDASSDSIFAVLGGESLSNYDPANLFVYAGSGLWRYHVADYATNCRSFEKTLTLAAVDLGCTGGGGMPDEIILKST